MGGDSFEGLQKLTNPQYEQMSKQLMERLQPYCQKIQPYIPLPEKEVHGDIDFLIILKPQYQPKDIIEQLKTEKYILNNNATINSVYKNKQVDYFFVKSVKQFELASFYKSYSGIGAYLGVFLPTKQIKITPEGLFALGFYKHLKLQFLVCDDISQILKFYGLDYQRYKEGFKTRKQLFEFIKKVRFLDEYKFAYHEQKAPTKLMLTFSDYLKNTGINTQKLVEKYDDALKQTLEYFNKQNEYEEAFNNLLSSTKRLQQLNSKFNATHLMSEFQIEAKQINDLKKQFKHKEFNNNEDEYYKFVENHTLQQILKEFQQKCNLKAKTKDKQASKNSQDSVDQQNSKKQKEKFNFQQL